MDIQLVLYVVIALAITSGTLFVTTLAKRLLGFVGLVSVFAMAAVFTWYCIYRIQSPPVSDDFYFALVMIFFAAPTILGYVIGCAVIFFRNRSAFAYAGEAK